MQELGKTPGGVLSDYIQARRQRVKDKEGFCYVPIDANEFEKWHSENKKINMHEVREAVDLFYNLLAQNTRGRKEK